jgi:hypothetical protein
MAATTHAFHNLVNVLSRNAAIACRSVIRVFWLNAAQAAQLLITSFFPFGDQISISDLEKLSSKKENSNTNKRQTFSLMHHSYNSLLIAFFL